MSKEDCLLVLVTACPVIKNEEETNPFAPLFVFSLLFRDDIFFVLTTQSLEFTKNKKRKGAGSQSGLLGSTGFQVDPPVRLGFARPIPRRVFT